MATMAGTGGGGEGEEDEGEEEEEGRKASIEGCALTMDALAG